MSREVCDRRSCAFVFPGQGSQYVGMGKRIYDAFSSARYVFEEVDALLGEPLSALMFEGPSEVLHRTRYAQPALMAVSIALLRVLQLDFGVSLGDIRFVAGHSLGEYSALCASGTLSIQQTTLLLDARARAMEKAPAGGMIAILGGCAQSIEEMIRQWDSEKWGVCELANDNSPEQVVLSGELRALEVAAEKAQLCGAKKCVPLAVSGPFHSSLMGQAKAILEQALSETIFSEVIIPVITNVSALPQKCSSTLREHLLLQMTGRVRWRETQQWLADQGVHFVVEVGAGKVLTKLAKRSIPQVLAYGLETPEEIETFAHVFHDQCQRSSSIA